jgi:hypothetical protein
VGPPYDWLAVISLAGPVVPLALVRQTQLVGLREIRLWCVADIILLVTVFYGLGESMPEWASTALTAAYACFRFWWIPKLAMRMQAFGNNKWYALLALVFMDIVFAVMFLFARTKGELATGFEK